MAQKPNSYQVEHHFEEYLKRMNLNPETMHPVQLEQNRQAFYGGWGQLLLFMQNYVADLPEMQGVHVLESMTKQVDRFWQAEKEKYQAKNQ